MSQNQTKISQAVKVETSEPKLFNVIFHNDDFTTMDFVVYVIMRLYRRSQEDAQRLMMKVHNEGTAVIGTYTYDVAMTKQELTIRVARDNHFPLQVSVELA